METDILLAKLELQPSVILSDGQVSQCPYEQVSELKSAKHPRTTVKKKGFCFVIRN